MEYKKKIQNFVALSSFLKIENSKALFSFFSCTLKYKADAFKFLQFEERFRKTPFSRRISVDNRPDCRNKAAL